MFVEGFQRPFATYRVPEEHRHKVNHLIVTEAAAGKAHTLSKSHKDIVATKILNHQNDFPEPGSHRGHRLARGLDDHRSISNTIHIDLLDGNVLVLPHEGDTFF